jgi:uncharacterized membrane protein
LLVGGQTRTQSLWIWALPVVFFAGAFLLALITLQLDRAVEAGRLPLPSWALSGDASDAQAVLSVVAGASISALTLVFSSALVVLTLAASQFGSFLLHDFIRMRISRLTLSMFVATFVYSLVILTRVGGGASGQFVPNISAKVAVLLAFASVLLLIGFIYSISVSVQAQHVAALVAVGLRRTIDERQRAHAAEGGDDVSGRPMSEALAATIENLHGDRAPVPATASGYLQAVRYRELVRSAQHVDGVVRLAYRPGQFVVAGSTLAEVWPAERGSTHLADDIRHAHIIGSQRTMQQDLEFALDKLVQIALIALSSAVNNTFNALICLDWLGDGLRMLAKQPSEWLGYLDARGTIRVITQPLPFGAITDAAFSKIRYASGGNPTVVIHLLHTITRLAPSLTSVEQRDALGAQADAAATLAISTVKLEVDRTAVLSAYRITCETLGRQPLHIPALSQP